MEHKNIKKIHNVLFVCTGNSCRSIMAEAYLSHRVKQDDLSIEIRSAGTLGIDGMDPTREVLELLRNDGIDSADYQSKALDSESIEWADLIFVMEPRHKATVLDMVPEALGKVRYLGDFSKREEDIAIPDPIGQDLSYYKNSYRRIKEAIDEFLAWVKT